jgi:glutathione synthase/RimK-type ligase-like ATP-grasp enzyme
MQEVVAILMPEITDQMRFEIRYMGLQNEIGCLGLQTVFTETRKSYNQVTHTFDELFTRTRDPLESTNYSLLAIRDLTMARDKAFDEPFYTDTEAAPIVHHPDLSKYLLNKANLAIEVPSIHPETIVASANEIVEAAAALAGSIVVIKPATGMASKDVFVGDKSAMPASFIDGSYLVQEFIDTSQGIEELDIEGVHNLRMISVDSIVIGAVSRIEPRDLYMLKNDDYGNVYAPDDLPETMLKIADVVHSVLAKKPGRGKNIIAIDTMRGKNANGETVDLLCETNRRPLRICPWTLISKQRRDPVGLLWLAKQWDRAEAKLLVDVASS